MPRSGRVLSFMSQWGPPQHDHQSSTSYGGPPSPTLVTDEKSKAANVAESAVQPPAPAPSSSSAAAAAYANIPPSPTANSPTTGHFRSSSQHSMAAGGGSSRPVSMIQTMQPPLMEVSQDTLPELQRIFSFLNAHSTKLYQEGYFLKLHDLDTRGRPSTDRVWTECFAQLVGTQLSLWDAQALDSAGEHGEVVPTFINLADASIKMIENLPMNSPGAQALQNVLSISTAANNRYLLHFNSLNSLTQWTAGIRLAMFEHSSLQEAYTGSLIAGKGRHLNNIRAIMNKATFKIEDWARVRFGAGTPWRRCWYVIEPPDEKELQKAQKAVKKNPYEKAPRIKGCIRFYDSNKIKKKTMPIATITDAYSAYAVYPVTRQLIDQSTLVKIDGQITIHGSREVETEGFVFIMPEVHPMVSGFEMLLRFLFPTWDAFNLYGRPTKLIADPIDSKGLMFALPTMRRYGYLEILDVASLIHTTGSGQWSEYRWRKEMKAITSSRMDITPEDRPHTRSSSMGSRRKKLSRSSLPGSRNGVRFGDETPPKSEPNSNRASPVPRESFDRPARADTTPNGFGHHRRSLSERLSSLRGHSRDNSRTEYAQMSSESLNKPPQPPLHRPYMDDAIVDSPQDYAAPSYPSGEPSEHVTRSRAYSPDPYEGAGNPLPEIEAMSVKTPPPEPVAAPPAFAHGPSQMPPVRPQQAVQSGNRGVIDDATLNQLADINRGGYAGRSNYASAGASAAWNSQTNGSHSRNSSSDSHQGFLSAPESQQRANSASPRYRQPRSNLPTIPASPFVDQMMDSPKASYFEPSAPPVPEHGENPSPVVLTPQATPGPIRPDIPRTGSSLSIRRKPVGGGPAGPQTVPDNASVRSLESLGSLKNAIIDQDLLEQIGNHDAAFGHPLQQTRSSSPDWASVHSHQSQQGSVNHVSSTERPRAGVKRTVGTLPAPAAAPRDVLVDKTLSGVAPTAPEEKTGKPTVAGGADQDVSSEFNIDFGPTYALTTGTRPGSSGRMSAFGQRGKSKAPPEIQEPVSAGVNTGSNLSPGYQSKAKDAGSPSSGGAVAWRPGLVPSSAQHQQKQSLSAHDWVQERAALAAQPMAPPPYAHARNKSSLELLKHTRSASATPPLAYPKSGTPSPATTPVESRQSSGDWLHLGRLQHQRSSSRELLQGRNSRPSSRQRNSPTLSMTPGVDVNKLTGKEREYLARSSGAPLMSMSGSSRSPQPDQPVGLVGAIAQREMEKSHVRDVSRSAAVQQALLSQSIQRQQSEAAHQRYNTVINPTMYPPQWQPQSMQQQAPVQPHVMPQSTPYSQHQIMSPMPGPFLRQSSYPASVYGVNTPSLPAAPQSYGQGMPTDRPYLTQQQSMQDLHEAARARIKQQEEEQQQRRLNGRQSMMSVRGASNSASSTYGQYSYGQGHSRGPTWG